MSIAVICPKIYTYYFLAGLPEVKITVNEQALTIQLSRKGCKLKLKPWLT